jgi:hypothetical protein
MIGKSGRQDGIGGRLPKSAAGSPNRNGREPEGPRPPPIYPRLGRASAYLAAVFGSP